MGKRPWLSALLGGSQDPKPLIHLVLAHGTPVQVLGHTAMGGLVQRSLEEGVEPGPGVEDRHQWRPSLRRADGDGMDCGRGTHPSAGADEVRGVTVMAAVSFRSLPVWPVKLRGHWRHSGLARARSVVDWTAESTTREVSTPP